MHASQLISIGLFTAAVVLTIYAWTDRIKHSSRYMTEAFDNPSDPLVAPTAKSIYEPVVPENPTDTDAIVAHKTLLRYTSQNLQNGLRFMLAISKQFFVQPANLRTDLNPSTLMNNYMSPLQI
jgi:hypothetical protein